MTEIVIQEKGFQGKFQLTLTNVDYFRIDKINPHKRLTNCHLKDIDVCWLEPSTQVLYLMEFKDYANPHFLANSSIDEKLEELIAKATDVLLILASVWSNSKKGQEHKQEIPESCCVIPRKIKFFFVLKLITTQIQNDIPAITTMLRNRLQGRAALFDIDVANDVVIIDLQQASQIFPLVWITTTP